MTIKATTGYLSLQIFKYGVKQSITRVKPVSCVMPMRLDDGWNEIELDLQDLTKKAYGTNYVSTTKIDIHANCRIRRVYFADKHYDEESIPTEYKLFFPIEVKQ